MFSVIDYDGRDTFLVKDSTDGVVEKVSVGELRHYVKDLQIEIQGVVVKDTNAMFTINGLGVELARKHYFKSGKWVVVVLLPGDRFGLTLTSVVKEPTVFFYDSSVKWNKIEHPYGQMVSSYHLDSILESRGYRLVLDCSVPAWVVDKEDFLSIKEWLVSVKRKISVV